MRKTILLILLLGAVMLTGCLPKATATPVTPPATITPATLAAKPTANSQPAPTVVLTVPAQAAVFPDSGCTVVTKKPTQGATAASIYPPVSTTDWVKGPADAKVTIIEYSDFQ